MSKTLGAIMVVLSLIGGITYSGLNGPLRAVFTNSNSPNSFASSIITDLSTTTLFDTRTLTGSLATSTKTDFGTLTTVSESTLTQTATSITTKISATTSIEKTTDTTTDLVPTITTLTTTRLVNNLSYAWLTITNSQDLATAAPFQQWVMIHPINYASQEAADLGNIRFYSNFSANTFSNPIPSWLASISSPQANQAKNASFWLKLPTAIPPFSSISLYMVFLPVSVDFDGIIAGEAPQLSSPYGLFDNGAKIFLYYNNGESITNLTSVNAVPPSVSNIIGPYNIPQPVLTLSGKGTNSSSEAVAWVSSPLYGDNYVAEGWISIDGNGNGLFAIRGANSSTTSNFLLGDGWAGHEASIAYERGLENSLLAWNGNRSFGWKWDYATISGVALNISIFSADPHSSVAPSLLSSAGTVNSTMLPQGVYAGIAVGNVFNQAAYFVGWRIRFLPPNGVMPTVS